MSSSDLSILFFKFFNCGYFCRSNVVYYFVVLICIFLIISDVEYFFICFTVIYLFLFLLYLFLGFW